MKYFININIFNINILFLGTLQKFEGSFSNLTRYWIKVLRIYLQEECMSFIIWWLVVLRVLQNMYMEKNVWNYIGWPVEIVKTLP
jgi:hypothetical protein